MFTRIRKHFQSLRGQCLCALARVYFKNGQYAKARKVRSKIHRKYGHYFELRIHLDECVDQLYNTKNDLIAYNCLTELITLMKSDYRAHDSAEIQYYLGLSACLSGHCQKAEEYIKLFENSIDMHCYIGKPEKFINMLRLKHEKLIEIYELYCLK